MVAEQQQSTQHVPVRDSCANCREQPERSAPAVNPGKSGQIQGRLTVLPSLANVAR